MDPPLLKHKDTTTQHTQQAQTKNSLPPLPKHNTTNKHNTGMPTSASRAPQPPPPRRPPPPPPPSPAAASASAPPHRQRPGQGATTRTRARAARKHRHPSQLVRRLRRRVWVPRSPCSTLSATCGASGTTARSTTRRARSLPPSAGSWRPCLRPTSRRCVVVFLYFRCVCVCVGGSLPLSLSSSPHITMSHHHGTSWHGSASSNIKNKTKNNPSSPHIIMSHGSASSATSQRGSRPRWPPAAR